MATYLVTPIRFVRRYSATTASRTVSLSDLTSANTGLKSSAWVASNEDGELFPHEILRPLPNSLNQYDAYIGAGASNKVLTGMVAYRATIPNNGIGLSVTAISTSVSCDEFTTDGARVAIEFSDSETPSTDWTTNREGDAYDVSTGSISITDGTGWKLKKYLWIYVSLENAVKLNVGIPCGSTKLVLPISMTLSAGQAISGFQSGETISADGFSLLASTISEADSAPDWPNIMKGGVTLLEKRAYLRELYFGRFRLFKSATSETYRSYGNFLLSSMLSNFNAENKTKSYDKDGARATTSSSPLVYNQMCQQTNEDNLLTNPGMKKVGVGLVANVILNPENSSIGNPDYDASKILIHLNTYVIPVSKTGAVYDNEIILKNGSAPLNLEGVGVRLTAWFVKGKSKMLEDVNGHALYISSALAKDNNFWTAGASTVSGSVTSEDGNGGTITYSLSATKLGSIFLPQVISAEQEIAMTLESPIDDFGFIILTPWISDIGAELSDENPAIGLMPSFDWKTSATNEGWKPAVSIR